MHGQIRALGRREARRSMREWVNGAAIPDQQQENPPRQHMAKKERTRGRKSRSMGRRGTYPLRTSSTGFAKDPGCSQGISGGAFSAIRFDVGTWTIDPVSHHMAPGAKQDGCNRPSRVNQAWNHGGSGTVQGKLVEFGGTMNSFITHSCNSRKKQANHKEEGAVDT
eukprot:scaffold2636_cov340-Pavlova_lutheri.AAC.83